MSVSAQGDAANTSTLSHTTSGAGAEEDADMGDFFVDLDGLQAHGINVADIKKLKAAGICTVRGLKYREHLFALVRLAMGLLLLFPG